MFRYLYGTEREFSWLKLLTSYTKIESKVILHECCNPGWKEDNAYIIILVPETGFEGYLV